MSGHIPSWCKSAWPFQDGGGKQWVVCQPLPDLLSFAQPQDLCCRAAEPHSRPHRVPRAACVPALPHHLPGPPPVQHLQVGGSSTCSSMGPGLGAWGCPQHSAPSLHCRTIYKVAYRQVYKQVPQPVASCCPGWSRTSSYELSCNIGNEATGPPQNPAHLAVPQSLDSGWVMSQ